MGLPQQLDEYIAACFTGLWVQSFEHEDALREIGQLCHERQWRLAVWDIAQGLQLPGVGDDSPTNIAASDPLAAIRAINALSSPESSAVLVLVNFHRFLSSPEIVQAIARQITTGKLNRTFVLILSPVVQIPVELEKLIVVLEHDLPGREQLALIAEGIATESLTVDNRTSPALPREVQDKLGFSRTPSDRPSPFDITEGMLDSAVAAEILSKASRL